MRKQENYSLSGSTLLDAGTIFMLSPLFLYWWIHGDYERYLWIINGPEPFSNFGSEPYQLGMFLGLEFLGVSMFAVGTFLRTNFK